MLWPRYLSGITAIVLVNKHLHMLRFAHVMCGKKQSQILVSWVVAPQLAPYACPLHHAGSPCSSKQAPTAVPTHPTLQVKLWTVASGLCYVTFAEHAAPVTSVAFLPSASALVSASLDGSVRAWDLLRYRNFRTMTSPTPVQFASLAVDPAGEVMPLSRPFTRCPNPS